MTHAPAPKLADLTTRTEKHISSLRRVRMVVDVQEHDSGWMDGPTWVASASLASPPDAQDEYWSGPCSSPVLALLELILDIP